MTAFPTAAGLPLWVVSSGVKIPRTRYLEQVAKRAVLAEPGGSIRGVEAVSEKSIPPRPENLVCPRHGSCRRDVITAILSLQLIVSELDQLGEKSQTPSPWELRCPSWMAPYSPLRYVLLRH